MRRLFIPAALVTSLLCAGGATAEEAKSEKHAKAATQYRQSLFQLIRSNMGPLGGMAKGAIPYDTAVMETNGLRLEQLATMMSDYFDVDTRKFNVDTSAKPEIWQDFNTFSGKADDLIKAAQALQLAAQSGNEKAYRRAIGGVGATCKSCHDDFKAD